jgi:site-specific DNA recombinase
MSAHTSTGKAPGAVAVYYRMSTLQQEDSVDCQRSRVLPYARAHGYTVAAEYVDEGIASDDVKRRQAFRRLLADCERGKVGVILCDDQDRFGRFDSIDFGYYVKPLRDRGVKLVTVNQGVIDWHSFAGRITGAVRAETCSEEVKKNARRVAGACAEYAADGDWLGGPTPYGLRPVLVDTPAAPDKDKRHRRKRQRLVLGDPQEVETVRLIFRLVGDHGWPLSKVVVELTARGIPSPSGKKEWRRQTLQRLLRNPVYVGDAVRGKRATGKYWRSRQGTLAEVTDRRQQVNPAAAWTVVADHHEAVIDRALWERVQRALAANQKLTTPHAGGGGFLLTGLLVCGHCGQRLSGRTLTGKRYYRCNLNLDCRGACLGYLVAEGRLVKGIKGILETLREGLYAPETVLRLEKILHEQAAALEREGPQERQELEAAIGKLDEFLEAGRERFTFLPMNQLTAYAETLRLKQEERDRLVRELTALDRRRPTAEAAEMVAEARARMNRLRDLMVSKDPAEVRSFLRSLLAKVTVSFTPEQRGRQKRYHFKCGTLTVFCADDSLTELSLTAGGAPGRPPGPPPRCSS